MDIIIIIIIILSNGNIQFYYPSHSTQFALTNS